MKYLVRGSEGPGFASPEEAIAILEKTVLPSLKELIRLEKKKKILAGGLPVGDRAIVLIVDAASNEELDRLLQSLPLWGVLKWEVTPLQTFARRAAYERDAVKELKKAI
jgi:muconolactone delta-isomerase